MAIAFSISTAHVCHVTMTLGTAASVYHVVPYNCKLIAVYTIIDAALATANEVLTVKNAVGGSTAGTVTITQAGSAAGDVDSVAPTTNNTFLPGTGVVEIATDGGNTVAARCDITLVFQPV